MLFDQKTTTAKNLYEKIHATLLPTYHCKKTCAALVKRVLVHYFQVNLLALTLNKPLDITPQKAKLLTQVLRRLQNHEPIQYIIGEAHFLNRNFQVNPNVLIPRPETAAWVHGLIKENHPSHLKIMDVGTGNGCIAITLQKELRAQVYALDISIAALKVAQHNAVQLQANVEFFQADILQDALPATQLDMMVSNPPYVCVYEKKHMQKNVLNHEPAQAIFVEDDQPIIFYKRIIALAQTHLKPGGKIYLEINEAFGQDIATLLHHHRFENVRIQKDLAEKDRCASGVLSLLA